MIVHRVRQLSVVEEDEPSSLPPLGSVDRVGKVPVRSNEQVATFRDLAARLVQLYGRGRVVLLQTEAVGALALVENIWSKFPALHIGHGAAGRQLSVQWSVVSSLLRASAWLCNTGARGGDTGTRGEVRPRPGPPLLQHPSLQRSLHTAPAHCGPHAALVRSRCCWLRCSARWADN